MALRNLFRTPDTRFSPALTTRLSKVGKHLDPQGTAQINKLLGHVRSGRVTNQEIARTGLTLLQLGNPLKATNVKVSPAISNAARKLEQELYDIGQQKNPSWVGRTASRLEDLKFGTQVGLEDLKLTTRMGLAALKSTTRMGLEELKVRTQILYLHMLSQLGLMK